LSESVNTQSISGEILRLAKLACALGEEPIATPSDFRHVLLGNRLAATAAPGVILLRFSVPENSIWVITWIYVRSVPTPALTAGAFNGLGDDWRSNQDLTPNSQTVLGQGLSFVSIEVGGNPITPNGAVGIQPSQILNRPVLLTFRSLEQVAIRINVNGPADPVIDLIGVINSYVVPIHIGNCLAKFSSGLPSPPALVVPAPLFAAASFRVFNIADPALPVQIGSVDSGTFNLRAGSMFLDGSICWVVNSGHVLFAIDVSTPSIPTIEDELELTPGFPFGSVNQRGVTVDGTRVYVITGGGSVLDHSRLIAVDGADTSNLATLRAYALDPPATTYASSTAVTITKQGAPTWAAAGFDTAGQVVIDAITYTYTGGSGTTTLTGVTPDPTAGGHIAGAVVEQGRVFAVNQRYPQSVIAETGTHRLYVISSAPGSPTVFGIYNATDPLNITQQAVLTLAAPAAALLLCDLEIDFPLVYALQGSDGVAIPGVLTVIDVTNPAVPLVVSTTVIGGVDPTEDLPFRLLLRGDSLYIATPTEIYTYDVSNPLAPVRDITLALNFGAFGNPVLSDFFVRGDTVFVGVAGNGESQGGLQSYDFPTGVILYSNELSVLTGWSMTGEP